LDRLNYLLFFEVRCYLGGPLLLTDITLGRYVQGTSLIHILDPRAKIICTVLLMTSLLGGRSALALGCTILLIGLFGQISKLPVRLLLGNLKPVLPLLVLTVFLHAWTMPGETLVTLPGGVGTFTQEGMGQGAFLAARFSAFVLGTSLLTLTTSPLELADGLESLLGPLKRIRFPVHEFAMTVTIALRFIPILVDEADRLRKAQLARGADFGGGPIKRIRSMLPLLMPLFISAFTRADKLAIAMEARCYRGDFERSRFRVLAFAFADGVAVILLLIFSGLALSVGRFEW
jgi:energy-coupling factor transport system permease protein